MSNVMKMVCGKLRKRARPTRDHPRQSRAHDTPFELSLLQLCLSRIVGVRIRAASQGDLVNYHSALFGLPNLAHGIEVG